MMANLVDLRLFNSDADCFSIVLQLNMAKVSLFYSPDDDKTKTRYPVIRGPPLASIRKAIPLVFHWLVDSGLRLYAGQVVLDSKAMI